MKNVIFVEKTCDPKLVRKIRNPSLGADSQNFMPAPGIHQLNFCNTKIWDSQIRLMDDLSWMTYHLSWMNVRAKSVSLGQDVVSWRSSLFGSPPLWWQLVQMASAGHLQVKELVIKTAKESEKAT